MRSSTKQIDITKLHKAADFCRKNKFYWDGVSTSASTSVNSCLSKAPSVSGGLHDERWAVRLRVKPVPPTTRWTFLLEDAAKPKPVVALFTDGNMREMRVPLASRRLTTAKPSKLKSSGARSTRTSSPTKHTTNIRFENYTRLSAKQLLTCPKFCTSRAQTKSSAKRTQVSVRPGSSQVDRPHHRVPNR